MRVSPKAFDTNAAIVGGYNTTRTGAKSAEGRTRAFIDEAADNLLYILTTCGRKCVTFLTVVCRRNQWQNC